MALDGEIKLVLSVLETQTVNGNSGIAEVGQTNVISLGNGTGANQADVLYALDLSTPGATPVDIDLAGGVVDAFGNTVNMAELVALTVVGRSASDVDSQGYIDIGNDANALASFFGSSDCRIRIPAGGFFTIASPDAAGLGAVTAGTGDTIQVTPDVSGTFTATIIAVGRSAA